MTVDLGTRDGRLNALAEINSAQRYLEVGVAGGLTFTKVVVDYRVAVDPKFSFDISAHANDQTMFHEVISDEFFSRHAKTHGQFDLIYLDGLHTFEQTLRDFCASMSFAHKRTIWLIDDTCPTSWLSSLPSLTTTIRLRRILHSKNKAWHGDVFKVVFAINSLFPQLRCSTFDGHGQTAVWFDPREDYCGHPKAMKRIVSMGYRHFRQEIDSFRVQSGEDVLRTVASSFQREA